jgi:ABC-2 type transport system permease protein
VVERSAALAMTVTASATVTPALETRRPLRQPAPPARALLAHEWRLLTAERLLHVVTVLFAVVISIALVNGARWTEFQRTTLAELRAVDSTQFASFRDTLARMAPDTPIASPFAPDPRNPMTIGIRVGTLASLDPLPLAPLAVGQSDLLPYYYRVTTGGRQAVLKGDEIENPGNLLTGRFDLAFVIVVLFPLVVLALCYNMVSGEREDGTLALVLSQPVRLRDLVLAKIAVRAVLLLVLVVLLMAIGLFALRRSLSAADVLIPTLWWLAIVTTYGAFWFGVALVINALVRSSAAAAVTSVTVWLLLVVLAPVVVNLAAQTRHPTPSRVAFITTARDATNQASALTDSILSRFLVDHPEMASAGVNTKDFYTRSLTVQDTVEKLLAPVYDAFDRQLDQQQSVIDAARLLTPALLTQTLFEELAGTGLHRWRNFRSQTLLFHRRWQEYFIPRQIRQEKLTVADIAAVPVFSAMREADSQVRRRMLTGISWLLAPTILLWGFGFWRLQRYRIVAS